MPARRQALSLSNQLLTNLVIRSKPLASISCTNRSFSSGSRREAASATDKAAFDVAIVSDSVRGQQSKKRPSRLASKQPKKPRGSLQIINEGEPESSTTLRPDSKYSNTIKAVQRIVDRRPELGTRPELLAKAKEDERAHFPVGMKSVYLPDFKLVYIRTPELHPRFAKFLVPLDFTKLDLRDFLYHGYNVRALNVRSWVYQRPVELNNRNTIGHRRQMFKRKQALKYMMIEMDEPFRGPALPETFEGSETKIYREFEKLTEREQKQEDQKNKKADWVKGTDDLLLVKKRRVDMKQYASQMVKGQLSFAKTAHDYPRPTYQNRVVQTL